MISLELDLIGLHCLDCMVIAEIVLYSGDSPLLGGVLSLYLLFHPIHADDL